MYMLRLFDESDPVHPIDARLLRDGVLDDRARPVGRLADPRPGREISRQHCEFHADAGRLRLRCVGTNGVYDGRTGLRLPDDTDILLDLPSTLRLGRFRLVAAPAPNEQFAPGAETRTMVLSQPLGISTEVPGEWADAQAPSGQSVFEEGSLLEAFCQGAGLDASALSDEDPEEIMRRAGAVYRQMVLGIGDLMAERDRARGRFNLNQTTIGDSGNNPFKWAPTQRLAIDLLRAGTNGFLSGPAALKASFTDIKRHLVATFAGLQASLRVAIDSFEPEEIDAAIADRTSLLKSRAAIQWQEVGAAPCRPAAPDRRGYRRFARRGLRPHLRQDRSRTGAWRLVKLLPRLAGWFRAGGGAQPVPEVQPPLHPPISVSRSHVGRVRSINEDRVFDSAPAGSVGNRRRHGRPCLRRRGGTGRRQRPASALARHRTIRRKRDRDGADRGRSTRA